MVELYYRLVSKKQITLDDVPKNLRAAVKKLLDERGEI